MATPEAAADDPKSRMGLAAWLTTIFGPSAPPALASLGALGLGSIKGGPQDERAMAVLTRLASLNRTPVGTKAEGLASALLRGPAYMPRQTGPLAGPIYDQIKEDVLPAHKQHRAVKGLIFHNPEKYNAGVLAHEVGHAKQPRLYGSGIPTRVLSGLGGFAAGTHALVTKNEDQGRLAGQLGYLAAAPTLADEFEASARGYRMLRRLGQSRLGAARSFVGVPSYLAGASVPMMTYGLKKFFGGYDKPETKQASVPAHVLAAMRAQDKPLLALLGRAGAKARATKALLAKRTTEKQMAEHLADPNVRHVMDWHEQDMADLAKRGATRMTKLYARRPDLYARDHGCSLDEAEKITQANLHQLMNKSAQLNAAAHMLAVKFATQAPQVPIAGAPTGGEDVHLKRRRLFTILANTLAGGVGGGIIGAAARGGKGALVGGGIGAGVGTGAGVLTTKIREFLGMDPLLSRNTVAVAKN